MWTVHRIDSTSVTLDFSSSGQGARIATSVWGDGTRLFNAIECAQPAPFMQVEVCESCGIPACECGGWVAFRRLAGEVLMLPVWNEMQKGEWERTEYAPPSFIGNRGIPRFGKGAWEQLRARRGEFPQLADLPPLGSQDACRWLQWFAPGEILGAFPDEPKLRPDGLVAVAEGELREQVERVNTALHLYFTQPEPVECIEGAPTPIEFYLNLPGTPSWSGAAHWGAGVCLLVDGELALRKANTSTFPWLP